MAGGGSLLSEPLRGHPRQQGGQQQGRQLQQPHHHPVPAPATRRLLVFAVWPSAAGAGGRGVRGSWRGLAAPTQVPHALSHLERPGKGGGGGSVGPACSSASSRRVTQARVGRRAGDRWVMWVTSCSSGKWSGPVSPANRQPNENTSSAELQAAPSSS